MKPQSKSFKQWVKDGDHLPSFLKGKEKQTEIIRAMYFKMQRPKLNMFSEDILPESLAQHCAFTFLDFIALHGYALKRSSSRLPFLSVDEALAEYRSGERNNKGPSQEIIDWMNRGVYLPDFLKDFHDAKDFFKPFFSVVDDEDQLNWIAVHCYMVDNFLWFLARFGYCVQRSNKRFEFKSLYSFVNDEKEQRAQSFVDMFNREKQ